jgi:hypothetical protein
LISNEKWKELLVDLSEIHMSHNQADFNQNVVKFREKYKKNYRGCYEYCKTWFTGKWSNWQIYHNLPGQANTNSNIESFNNIIKKKFTLRTKLNMKAALKAIEKLIVYYSTEPEDFQTYPRFDSKIKETADKFSKANFKKITPTQYHYHSLVTETKFKLTINDPLCHAKCSCECKDFIKKGVCCHLVGLSSTHNLELYFGKYADAPKFVKDKFVCKTKKGRKRGKPLYGKALEGKEDDVEVVVNIPKKRGRKPKSKPVQPEPESTTAPTGTRKSKRLNK